MKNRRASLIKRASLLAMLAVMCAALTACYMEPDRVVDNQNGLNTLDGSQGFQNVITPEPTQTPVPTPAPTSPEKDWSSWEFSFDTPTDPPSNVILPSSSPLPLTPNPPAIGTTTISTATPAPNLPTGGSSVSSATPTPKPASLQMGSEGADVKRMQQQLKNLGYYTGSVDGKFGQGTLQAVRDFQAAHKLTVDGKAGSRTINMLYSSNAKKKTEATVTAPPASGGSSSGGSSSGGSSSTSSMYTNGETDIYLEPGTARGSQVKIMQNRLIVLGYLTGTADGVYDETTTAAVKAFQKRNDLWDDGIAGPTTLAKLYSSSARKASSVVGHLGSLKEGMNGSAVRTLQKNLKTLGYYTGSVDGDYGAGTTNAVKNFQKDHGLKADGIAGKSTLNAIQSALSGGSSGSSSGSSSSSGGASAPDNYGKTASSNGYTTIHSGSNTSSSNVTALQSALSATGYYGGSLDGKFGSGTEDAVKKYQRAKGLRVTGMAGPTTQRLLYGGTGESGSYSKLQMGSSGSAVKRLQYALYELKYYDGPINGKYDNATENAVMLFQEVNHLEIDGVAGQATQRRLFSSNAKPCDI